MAYDRAWLRAQVSSYLHDAEVTPLIDTWIDIGAKRVSQVLQCWEMETELTIGLAAVVGEGTLDGGTSSGGGIVVDGGDAYNTSSQSLPYMEIGSTVKQVLGVQWQDQEGQWRNLVALNRHEARQYKRGGIPGRYLIEDRRIHPLPFIDGSYRAQLLSEVVIPPTPDDIIDAVVSYPFIFLNAALSEAFDWKQDDVMNQRYEQKWFTEATTVRNAYMQDRAGESLAMRAM
jgi:hypothetical protein